MTLLTRADLWSLEEYAARRQAFRREVMAHKKNRQVQLHEHARLLFEDALTIKYQVQEMLRAEKIFEAAGIEEELDAYNPLIPDGDNWKGTLMLEYEDVEERKRRLAELINVENLIWTRVAGHDKVYAIADEDLERGDEEKTASVHFVRFQLDSQAIASLRNGALLSFGIDHERMRCETAVTGDARAALLKDLH